MYGNNIVAIFETRNLAERAQTALNEQGFTQVRLSSDSGTGDTSADTAEDDNSGGFFDWLFGSADEDDRDMYRSNLTGERTAVSVHTEDDNAGEAERILEQFEPIDISDEDENLQAGGSTGAMAGRPEAAGGFSAIGSERSGMSGRRGEGSTENLKDKTVIPIVEEKLAVGKRVQETRHRVRSYVVEKPVEASVELQDERVVIERRPASGTASNAPIRNRDYEVIERHEVPVVGKESKVAEEVVVSKDISKRTEKVRDTVRETKVDIDGENTSGKPRNGR